MRIALLTAVGLVVCALFAAASRAEVALVPAPVELEQRDGAFTLGPQTPVTVEDPEALRDVAAQLIEHVEEQTGVVLRAGGEEAANAIVLRVDGSDAALGAEGYELTVAADGIVIRGGSPAGVFYGMQSLRQLLPWSGATDGTVRVPAVRIVDRPRYAWRGMMLDVGRHFFDAAFIKRQLDLMALHKLNTFHWHLTEDQGWRLAIERDPLLAKVGGYRRGEGGAWYPDGELRGGYYTQDQVREVIDYARRRFITVVPEIEMPGHAQAALAVHPELSCTGGPFHVSRRWGVHEDIFCAGREETFAFLTGVLDEVCALFPGPYVHIGGDEAPKARWETCPRCQQRMRDEGLANKRELQSYFIRRIERHLAAKGKRLIGWDEILEGGLAPNAAVMSWRGTEGGIAAARAGHDVVMSPHTHLYFDYYASDHLDERGAFTPPIPLRKVYGFEPTPAALSPEEAAHVLGAQANVWTEQISTPAGVEYMAVPRLCALAEVVWSPAERRDWPDFQRRLSEHYGRLDAMGVRYRVPMPVGGQDRAVFQASVELMLRPPMPHGVVRYTLDGSEPTAQSPALREPLRLTETTTVHARTFLPDGRASLTRRLVMRKMNPLPAASPGALKPGLRYQLYEGRYRTAPDVDSLTPREQGTVDQLAPPPGHPDEDFALELTGYLHVEQPGEYLFSVRANDGARLWIGGELVSDNPGAHWTRERRGPVLLDAGWHRLRLVYHQAWGEQALAVRWAGPGFDLRPISAEALAHDDEQGAR